MLILLPASLNSGLIIYAIRALLPVHLSRLVYEVKTGREQWECALYYRCWTLEHTHTLQGDASYYFVNLAFTPAGVVGPHLLRRVLLRLSHGRAGAGTVGAI